MSLRTSATLLALLASGAATAAAQQTPAATATASPAASPLAEDPAVTPSVKKQYLAWETGKVDHADYNADANKQLTPELVAQVAAQLQPLGDPTKFTYIEGKTQGGYRFYAYRVETPKTRLRMEYVIDSTGKIAGIRFSPAP